MFIQINKETVINSDHLICIVQRENNLIMDVQQGASIYTLSVVFDTEDHAKVGLVELLRDLNKE